MKTPDAAPTERSLHWIMAGVFLVFCGFFFVLRHLLLAFHGHLRTETELKRLLPEGTLHAEASAIEEPTEAFLDLAQDGAITLDGEGPVTDLPLTLKGLVQKHQGSRLIVTVSSHEQTRYEHVLKTMRALEDAGIKNFTFTVGADTF